MGEIKDIATLPGLARRYRPPNCLFLHVGVRVDGSWGRVSVDRASIEAGSRWAQVEAAHISAQQKGIIETIVTALGSSLVRLRMFVSSIVIRPTLKLPCSSRSHLGGSSCS